MSCGQKECRNEIAEADKAKKLSRLASKELVKVQEAICYVVDELQIFIHSNPSLTRTQWGKIDSSLKILKELLN